MVKQATRLAEIDNSFREVHESENGKVNSYSHHCDIVMHSKNYATCLHLIDTRASGKLETLYSECSVAISKKRCPALAMRKEEVNAGHAIYFKERIKNLGESFMNSADNLLTGMIIPIKAFVKPTESHKLPVTIKPKDDFQPDMGGYANAINNSLKNGVVPIELAIPKPVEGESLMDIAKRMMGSV